MKRLMQFNPEIWEKLHGFKTNEMMRSMDQSRGEKNTSSRNLSLWYYIIANDNTLEGL